MRARLSVPYHGCAISGSRGNPPAVGRDANLGDGLLVAAQLERRLEVGAERLVGVAVARGRGGVV